MTAVTNVRMVVRENNIPRIIVNTNKNIQALAAETRREILQDAKEHAPVAPPTFEHAGRMRDSGKIQGIRIIFDAVNRIGRNFPFFVEYGTRNTPAQPFLRPAVRRGAAKMQAGLKLVIRK